MNSALTINIGNYTLSALMTHLQTLGLTKISTFSVSQSSLTNKITRANTSAAFNLSFPREIASILGFKKTSYSGSLSYTSEQAPNMQSPQVILLFFLLDL